MKIVHLSTYDIQGGAAISARRLHQGLLKAGHESAMFVKYRSGQDPSSTEYILPMDLWSRWKRRARRRAIVKSQRAYARPAGYELFSDDRTPYGVSVLKQVASCDVINLHWVAAYVDYESFFPAAVERGVVVWTLHDMNPATGGCHYDMNCGRYAQACGTCPQLGSNQESDLSREIWLRKVAVFNGLPQARFCVVAPSRWLSAVARTSPLLSRFRVETIPYGIDLEQFAPRDRHAARDVLGIPQDAHVVLFVAEMVDNRRKGFPLLAEALGGCTASLDKLWLLSVGHHPPRIEGAVRGSHINYIGNDRMLSLIYSAADLFVIPSLQDNLPNTVMEAMACGTPVVGFDVGGVRDMIRDGSTGLLVNAGDIDGLKNAILALLRDPYKCREMGRQGRAVALSEYPLALQAQRYADLYKDLLSRR